MQIIKYLKQSYKLINLREIILNKIKILIIINIIKSFKKKFFLI